MGVRVALAAVLALLAVPSGGFAHGDGAARGYRSTVTSLEPAAEGLSVEVLEGDDRLMLTNETGDVVVVHGYGDEPYLRFTEDGVFRNRLSPATYLNDDRYGNVEVPEEASEDAEPDWEQVAERPSYEWHDHRIHWMSTTDPPVVGEAPDEAHHISDWRVGGLIGDQPLAIEGTLDYEPPPESSFNKLLLVPLVVVVLLVAGVLVARRRAPVHG